MTATLTRPPAAAPPAAPRAAPRRGTRGIARRHGLNTPATLRALLASLVLLSLAWGAFGGWVATVHSSAAAVPGQRGRAAQPRRQADVPGDRRRRRDDHRRVPGRLPAAPCHAAALPGRHRDGRHGPVPAAVGRRRPGREQRARRAERRAARLYRVRRRGPGRVRDGLPADRRLVPPGRLRGSPPRAAARREHRLHPGERRAQRGERRRDRLADADRRPGTRDRHRHRLVPGAAVADPAHQPDAQPRARPRLGAAHHQRGRGWPRASSPPARTSAGVSGTARRPRENLALAAIGVQQIRGDAVLNFISRSGNASFADDFAATSKKVGPGTGSWLGAAAAAQQPGGQGAALVAPAEQEATAWYAANGRVYSLGSKAEYAAERNQRRRGRARRHRHRLRHARGPHRGGDQRRPGRLPGRRQRGRRARSARSPGW